MTMIVINQCHHFYPNGIHTFILGFDNLEPDSVQFLRFSIIGFSRVSEIFGENGDSVEDLRSQLEMEVSYKN